jgi:hypothetical protein
LKKLKYKYTFLAIILLLSLFLTACNATNTPSATESNTGGIANCTPGSAVPTVTPAPTAPAATVAANAPKPTPTLAPLPVPTVALPNNAEVVLTEVQQETEKVRGLTFINQVEKYIVKRSELGSYFLEDFKRSTTLEEIATVEKTLRLFGFTPQDFDYIKTYSELLGDQVLGFYSPESKKFYIVVDDPTKPLSPLGQHTTQHELTHALQDQYFNIQQLRPSRKDSDKQWNDDRDYAVTALIEGDAVQSGNQWVTGGYLTRQELNNFINEAQSAGNDDTLSKAPLILRDTLTFPYVEGANFVAQLCKQGGYAAVNKAFTEYPPVSTSQILNFEKYSKRIEPVKVELPDMVQTLGNTWKSVDINTIGELQSRIWLDGQLNKDDATKAASGWAGDRYQVLENNNKQLGFVWRSAWDSDNEAREFFDNAAKYLTIQFKLSGGSGDKRTWQNSDSDFIATIKGKEVLISVMPKGDSLTRVVQKLGF